MPPEAFANVLTNMAGQVKLSRYPKKKRGPKKPRPARKSAKKNIILQPHVCLQKGEKKDLERGGWGEAHPLLEPTQAKLKGRFDSPGLLFFKTESYVSPDPQRFLIATELPRTGSLC
jgi:hypothetical protein